MITAFDANFLLMLLDKKAKVPQRPGKPQIRDAQERIDLLVQDLTKRKAKIVIPTPALAEFLLIASDAYDKYLALLKSQSVFEILGFDEPACVELVDLSLINGKPKKVKPEDTWAKLKYDRQILAIAKANRAQSIHTTDDGLGAFAKQVGVEWVDLGDLPVPPPKQEQLPLVQSATAPDTKLLPAAEQKPAVATPQNNKENKI